MLQKKKQTRSHLTIARPSFTLAEMILVVALTLFLLVVSVQGFVNSASQFSFANVAEKIQEMVRSARSLAISGKAQIDYVDFDKDGCKDKFTTSACLEDDYVTPAHYGVNFAKKTVGPLTTYTVTMFADNHQVSGQTPKEGVFDDKPGGAVLADYQNGWDIVLDRFVLPVGPKLIIPLQTNGSTTPGSGTSATIFFSPIFADVSSDVNVPAAPPLFKFGVAQTQGTIIRKRCSAIHLLAGISEPQPATTLLLANCP